MKELLTEMWVVVKGIISPRIRGLMMEYIKILKENNFYEEQNDKTYIFIYTYR